jgi:hypothetical protein
LCEIKLKIFFSENFLKDYKSFKKNMKYQSQNKVNHEQNRVILTFKLEERLHPSVVQQLTLFAIPILTNVPSSHMAAHSRTVSIILP